MLRLSMLALVAVLIGGALAWAEPVALAPDEPTRVSDIEVVCTGVGLDARADPRWSQYPLKIEFAGAGGRYLGDVVLSLVRNGITLASVRCGGPWLLFRLAPGRYEVEARSADQAVRSAAFVPASGQGRIILRFAEPAVDGAAKPTYPMNYGEEAVQALGLKNGRLALTPHGGGAPEASLGVDHGHAGIKLRLPLDGK